MAAETAEMLYEELGPFAALDDETQPFLQFLDALAEPLFEPIHELVSDREETVGWEIALDPDAAPARALGWLAQFAGATFTSAMSETDQREKIKAPDGPRRGTLPALIAAVKATLTGSRTVIVNERYGGSGYQLRVRTLAGEHGADADTLAAILSQKPMGNVLTYEAVETGDWDDVAAAFTDWDDVATADDWDAVAMTPPA